MKSNKKIILLLSIVLFGFLAQGQNIELNNVSVADYLNDLKNELQIEWPKNRTINLVFHGHSVPAGYFKTPVVNTISAYPNLVLKRIKSIYPHAVVNVIVTAIGGENSVQGSERFQSEVLIHRPDVLFIDYALNDRRVGLEESYKAWDKMIKQAKQQSIKVILLTPSPDQKVNFDSPDNELKKHADQIIRLAKENQVGLVDSYKSFEFLYSNKKQLAKYMSQVNHPNEKGHELIANEIIKYFAQ
jgi:acyl-CoA thioesterase-1